MAKKTLSPPKSYEEAERELHAIVEEIEAGEIGLEESLAKYERGRSLLQYCRDVLERAEKQIELLGKDGEGKLTVKRSAVAVPEADTESDEADDQD